MKLGSIELLIGHGQICSWVIQDAISARFAGQIMQRFLQNTPTQKQEIFRWNGIYF